jgi:hypothetical protein
MRRATLWIVGLFFFSVNAISQTPVLSEAEFRRVIEPRLANDRWVSIPVGRWELNLLDNAYHKVVFENITAHEKAGTVRVENLTEKGLKQQFSWDQFAKATSNSVDLVVTLNSHVDLSHIEDIKGNISQKLLKLPTPTIDKIVKIDAAKGGATLKWDGSVVYAIYGRPAGSALLFSYVANLPPHRRVYFNERTKRRILFKYDAFSSQWRFVAEDIGAIDSPEFGTSNVVQALQRD